MPGFLLQTELSVSPPKHAQVKHPLRKAKFEPIGPFSEMIAPEKGHGPTSMLTSLQVITLSPCVSETKKCKDSCFGNCIQAFSYFK